MTKICEAFNIAVTGLRSCYTDEGTLAGKHNFVDYWARDSLFASLGSIAIGDFRQAEINLNLYLKHQKASGHLPYRIISINQFMKYLHFEIRFKKPIANYNSPLGDQVVDQNILLPIVAYELFKANKNEKYLSGILPNLELCFFWLKRQDWDNDGLIEEGYLANWMDHAKKRGKTLINNVLYQAALQCFIALSDHFGNRDTSQRFQLLLNRNKSKTNKLFWNDNYFIDWIDSKRHTYLDTAGNLFAIIYNLADTNQSDKILLEIDKYLKGSFIPKANYPYYKKRLIRPHLFLAGLADYAGYRLWIGALQAIAVNLQGDSKRARQTMESVATSIVKHQGVYEIYTSKGDPLRRWPAYNNEVPFAWSCGVFIWAISKIYPEYKNWL